MWNKIREHYLVLCAAFIMAVLILFPVFFFYFASGSSYKGINIAHFGTDSHFYLSRAREALDGLPLGNPLLQEGKNGPDSFFMYTERFLMSPIRALSFGHPVDVVFVYHVLTFIGVMVLVFLLYILTLQLGGNKIIAIAAAVFAIGGYSIIYNKTIFYTDFNIYGRPTIPLTSSIVSFLYLNLFLKVMKGGSRHYLVGAIIAIGALFNMYFYAWSFAVAFNVIFATIYLYRKDWSRFRDTVIITCGGIILGAYNLYNLFSYLNSESGKQSSYFLLLQQTHAPIFSKIGFGMLLLFTWYLYKKGRTGEWLFIFGIIITFWAVLNEQVVTGRSLQYGHYYWYFIVPLSIVVGIFMIWSLLSKKSVYQTGFALFLIIIVCVNTVGGQYRSSLTNFDYKLHEQEFRPLIDFINDRNDASAVILTTDSSDGYLFTVYTHNDIFWNSGALLLNTPIDRAENALLLYSYFNKVARADFTRFLININEDRQSWPVYRGLYEDLEGYWSGKDYGSYNNAILHKDPSLMSVRKNTIGYLSKHFNERMGDAKKVRELLQKYKVRYIVWDENANPEWDLSVLPNLVERVHQGELHLYELVVSENPNIF